MVPQAAPPRLVLASASPRRSALLGQLGLHFAIDPAEVDETAHAGEAAGAYVLRLSAEKAARVAERHAGAVVLGADTAVVLGGAILGKPASAEEAGEMLSRLSGRTHRVLTGIAVAGPRLASMLVETAVTLAALSPRQIAWYVGTGEPMDKAGAYGMQDRGGALVRGIEGSHSSVIGLPLVETLELLRGAGVWLPWEVHR